jgi:hypothetical protein
MIVTQPGPESKPRKCPMSPRAARTHPLPNTASLWYQRAAGPACIKRTGRASDGGSSNGRTADSDSASLGSNPSPPAKLINGLEAGYAKG